MAINSIPPVVDGAKLAPLRSAQTSSGLTDGGFSELVGQLMQQVSDAGAKSDLQARSVAAGGANVVDVVTAVAESETALQTLVAVRDRAVSAYEEVMRMQV